MKSLILFATLALQSAVAEGGLSKSLGRFSPDARAKVLTQTDNSGLLTRRQDTTKWAPVTADRNAGEEEDEDQAQKLELNGEGSLWTINHSATLIDHLQNMLRDSNTSDITLKVHTVHSDEVKVFHTHYLLLTLQSEVFENLLQNQSMATLVLRETAECAALFEKFIRYLYCGEITIMLDQAVALHKLASKYHVTALDHGIMEYMRQRLASDLPQGHVVSWYHYASKTGNQELQDLCKRVLAWNMSPLLHSGEWYSISQDLLLSLLQRSDLVAENELEIYSAVEEWLSRNRPETAVADSALRSIRYAMIAPRELFHIQKESPVMSEHYVSVQDLFFLAFQFHSSTALQFAKYFDVNCSLFVPRNYLSGAWGSQWVINNPARDDRSSNFQTQLGPNNYDAGKKVTWNVLFSPRWLPVSLRSSYADHGAIQALKPVDVRPRIIVTPASNSADFAGVSFQKTVLVRARQDGRMYIKHIYDFHQSTEETGDFLLQADLQKRTSDYLIDNSLHLHVIVKPIYQPLIKAKK